MICRPLRSPVLKKSAVRVDLAATIAVVHVRVLIAQRLAEPFAVLWGATLPLQMAAISLLRQVVPMPINPPLSAFAKSPRQLQQLTVKENNYVATRSPEIPQRAKRP
jgi:hypothetical protein